MKKNFILFLIVAGLALIAIFVIRNIKDNRIQSVIADHDQIIANNKIIFDNIFSTITKQKEANMAANNNTEISPQEEQEILEIEEKIIPQSNTSTKIEDLEKDAQIIDIDKDLEDLENIDQELDNLLNISY